MKKEVARREIEFLDYYLQNHTDDYGEESHTAMMMAISALSENKGEWIPVTERLPEGRYAVLVYCPEYKNTYCAYYENNQWWIFGAFIQLVPNAVVAWMPLPEPYKEGGE